MLGERTRAYSAWLRVWRRSAETRSDARPRRIVVDPSRLLSRVIFRPISGGLYLSLGGGLESKKFCRESVDRSIPRKRLHGSQHKQDKDLQWLHLLLVFLRDYCEALANQ